MKYRFMNEHRHQYAITTLCRVLQVARAGFYQWLHKPVSDREKENGRLLGLSHNDINLLVNAARVFYPKAFLEHTESDYEQYLSLNKAFFFITQKVVANLVASERPGAIVNIGSMWGKQAIAATPSSAYSMAKAGLHSLTQHLAMELAPKQIRVNAVSPAVVETPIYEGFIPKAEVHGA